MHGKTDGVASFHNSYRPGPRRHHLGKHLEWTDTLQRNAMGTYWQRLNFPEDVPHITPGEQSYLYQP